MKIKELISGLNKKLNISIRYELCDEETDFINYYKLYIGSVYLGKIPEPSEVFIDFKYLQDVDESNEGLSDKQKSELARKDMFSYFEEKIYNFLTDKNLQ